MPQGLVASLAASTAQIAQYEQELAACDTAVSELKADFAARTDEAAGLRKEVEAAEGTLAAARSLLDKLSGEKSRWVEQVRVRVLLVGDSVHGRSGYVASKLLASVCPHTVEHVYLSCLSV